jgi:uncharacterized protein
MANKQIKVLMDSKLLKHISSWRDEEDNEISQDEAICKLIEAGLNQITEGKNLYLSDGEKLIAMMLSEFIQKRGVKIDMDVNLIQKAIRGGHHWVLNQEMSGMFPDRTVSLSSVKFVNDVLYMWKVLEEDFRAINEADHQRLNQEIPHVGKYIKFPGFDSDTEGECFEIAHFIVDQLKRFPHLRNRSNNLDSHSPTFARYIRMLRVFEPIHEKLIDQRKMNVEEFIQLLQV